MPDEMLNLPVIPLRGLTILPGTTVHFDVSRKQSIAAANEAVTTGEKLFVVTQKDPVVDAPGFDDVYKVGTVVEVKQLNKMPDRIVRVMVEAKERGIIHSYNEENSCIKGDIEIIKEPDEKITQVREIALLRELKDELALYDGINHELTPVGIKNIDNQESLSGTMLQIIMRIRMDFKTKQKYLEANTLLERYEVILSFFSIENEISQVKAEIIEKVKTNIDKNQREHILREQMRVIRDELGENDATSDIDEMIEKTKKLNADDEIKEKILKEIKRLRMSAGNPADSNVLRNYIETMLDMPWNNCTEENQNVEDAEKILNRDHYGLTDVKERMLEFLSVRVLTKDKGESPIVCLVGPPGTGKTSIARSIAEALNKKYVRICLGGVTDESEIRGHRKTYVGAMPGRIATAIRQANTANPLILLDEIDKLGQSIHGDPAAAMLEVLDSEQNSKFRDNYLEVPLDLSKVMFIATANDLSTVPRPLLDRMEIVEVSSYTDNEKFHIAKEHLIQKELEQNGLKRSQLTISDEAINKIIKYYTKEAGVRSLDRTIAKICRKAAKIIVGKEKKSIKVTSKNITKYLGKEKFRQDEANEKNEIGIVRGLAWTSVGGDTLQIEVNTMPGKGILVLTGNLGDVMKESAQIALSYAKSVAKEYGVDSKFFKENDIHMHIPEGAVPKDGPSAGITMSTAIVSAIANIPVDRYLAMTGEVTLRGKVLPIGGLKEKLLAAKDAGMKKVLVPVKNKTDVEEFSTEITDRLKIVYVSEMTEVLKQALVK
ncbi:endopeptidase La [Eubacterium sp. AF19-12LB]|jgi:ATP-dependent Lon protease|uniref:endopeptidase La n=1 Tax=Eubacterium TaxID=1730 RepID=UPI000E4A5FC5|nr:endopeptidase La [Eubacterium sp. AF19-12LB]RHR34722.1 endopeptidase La [Eubacterium sp. AF19-12LB]